MSAERAPQGLRPTLAVCALLLLALTGLVGRLTDGFESWTYETLRRERAQQGRLHAPAMELRDAQDRPLRLFAPGSPPAPVYLVDFIYTRCLTVCQALGSEYFRMQESLRARGAPVQLLSVSIDPRHDDAQALAAHGALHRADASRWSLAAARDEAAGRAALRQLGVVAIPDGQGGYVHNGSIHLIAGSGRVLRIYDYAQWEQALAEARRAAAAAPVP